MAKVYEPVTTKTVTIRPKNLGIAKLYEELLNDTVKQGSLQVKNTIARKWISEQAITPEIAKKQIKSSTARSAIVGNMYMFQYDPKTKDKLPYYDQFPVVFPFKRTKEGFLGINVHYLPYSLRAKLMDELVVLINNEKYDETTQLQAISYETLQNVSHFFKPCVKHYLNNQIYSRIIKVHPKHWELALFLPLEQFVKADKQVVYRDTSKILRESR